jgi:hypothetical protein
MYTEDLFDEEFKQKAIKAGHAEIKDGEFVFTEKGEGFREGIMHTVDFAIKRPDEFNQMIALQKVLTERFSEAMDKFETNLDKKIDEFLKGFRF